MFDVLPLFLTRLDRRDKLSPYDFDQRRDLGAAGAPGWHLRTHGNPVSDAMVQRLLTAAVQEVLARRAPDPYFGVLLLRGTLVVRRNGFVLDPGELDRLAVDTCTIADAVRDACLPELAPRSLTEPLPSPRSSIPRSTRPGATAASRSPPGSAWPWRIPTSCIAPFPRSRCPAAS